jgi:hypothetical protein
MAVKDEEKNITIKKLTSIVEKNARRRAVSDLGCTDGVEAQ